MKKLYTIVAGKDFLNPPLVDVVYCAHKPTPAEVKKVHDHLQDFEDEELDIQEYTDIPTIA